MVPATGSVKESGGPEVMHVLFCYYPPLAYSPSLILDQNRAELWQQAPGSNISFLNIIVLLPCSLSAHLCCKQATGGGVHAYPEFISCIFSYVFREFADAYLKGAVILKIVGSVESLWFKLSEKLAKKTLHRHLRMVGGFKECLCKMVQNSKHQYDVSSLGHRDKQKIKIKSNNPLDGGHVC